MFTVPIESVGILLAGALLGFVGHVLFKVGEVRAKENPAFSMSDYLRRAPYMTGSKLICVVAAAVAVAGQTVTPMQFATAVGIGYLADSAGNHLRRFMP